MCPSSTRRLESQGLYISLTLLHLVQLGRIPPRLGRHLPGLPRLPNRLESYPEIAPDISLPGFSGDELRTGRRFRACDVLAMSRGMLALFPATRVPKSRGIGVNLVFIWMSRVR